ncbi:hypothetical protein F5146DRAFT_1133929 [Armillaria mellea]|nr:hypothetical protein F5146DRAFT_1133929 [Armillaria mellea]
MSGDSNIGAWIQFAKLTAAAGEMALFPYIKGVAGCVATILEVIEQAGKNNEDLQDLAESIGTTIQIIKETVEAHSDMSATRFRDIGEPHIPELLFRYLESLIGELDTSRRNVKSKRITQFLTTKKVSGVIDGYKQRVNDIRVNYLVLVTTDSRLVMSEMHDGLGATVESQAHSIRSEIHSSGDIQREHVTQIYERLQNPTGYYKGQLFLGDIYITNPVSPSRGDSALEYQDRYGTVECSSTAKIIRVYQHSPTNEEAILERFNVTADAFINIKHPNIAQIFGICRSLNFPAIVFHGSTQIPFDDYERNLTAKQIIPFYLQLFYDLESVAEYLSRHSISGSITVPLPYTRTQTYLGEIYLCPSNESLDSWIGQASQLESSICSKGHVEDDELSLIVHGDMAFKFFIDPVMYDSFCLCDTFMAKDHRTLLLSIRAPSIEHQTNKMSFPVFMWYDGDLELSAVEVEESFGVVVEIKQYSCGMSLSKTVLTTIHKLNANYGFDPGRGGADVCEYFGWPLMEIWDISTGDWAP